MKYRELCDPRLTSPLDSVPQGSRTEHRPGPSYLRVMLHARWSAEAWSVGRVEFRRALAVRSEIRRAGWFN